MQGIYWKEVSMCTSNRNNYCFCVCRTILSTASLACKLSCKCAYAYKPYEHCGKLYKHVRQTKAYFARIIILHNSKQKIERWLSDTLEAKKKKAILGQIKE